MSVIILGSIRQSDGGIIYYSPKSMIRLLTKNAGEAEIAKLYNSITREQNVFRFDISMNTIVQMAIVDSLQRLPNDAHGGLHWYPVKLIFKIGSFLLVKIVLF